MVKLVKMNTKSFQGSFKLVEQRWRFAGPASELLAQVVYAAQPTVLDRCLRHLHDYDLLAAMMMKMLFTMTVIIQTMLMMTMKIMMLMIVMTITAAMV